MNLEALRAKRAKRVGVKAAGHAGQRRIFFISDRAVRKFHGDLGLWIQYVEYARKQKAYKKVSQILTDLLRLHPTKPELWTYAANYAMDQHGDMTEARSYMQRGLRFCKRSKDLWLEYARLEMIYIAKIAARRQILGLNEDRNTNDEFVSPDKPDADLISLPVITAEEVDPNLRGDESLDENSLKNLSTTPALSGAIPIAILSAAMDEFSDGVLGERFYDICISFEGVPCRRQITQHFVEILRKKDPHSPSTLRCFIQQPLIEIEVASPEFPGALGLTLDRIKSSVQEIASQTPSRAHPFPRLSLMRETLICLLPYLGTEGLDLSIHRVLEVILKKIMRQLHAAVLETNKDPGDEYANIFEQCLGKDKLKLATPLLSWSLQQCPSNSRLLVLQKAVAEVPVND